MDNLLSWDKDSKPELLNVSSGIREETNITSENIGDEHHTGATGRAHFGKEGKCVYRDLYCDFSWEEWTCASTNLPFIYSLPYLFLHLFCPLCHHSFCHSFNNLFLQSFLLPFISSIIASFCHSSCPSFYHSFTPSFIHSVIYHFFHCSFLVLPSILVSISVLLHPLFHHSFHPSFCASFLYFFIIPSIAFIPSVSPSLCPLYFIIPSIPPISGHHAPTH